MNNGNAHPYTAVQSYKMAEEAVLDDSKNESGIPRAVFVVRNRYL